MLIELGSPNTSFASVARSSEVSESTARRWHRRVRRWLRQQGRNELDLRDLNWLRLVLTRRGRGTRPRLENSEHADVKRRLARWARGSVSVEVHRRSSALLVFLNGGTLDAAAKAATRSSGISTSVSTVHRWKTGLSTAIDSGETDEWLAGLQREVRTSSKKGRAKRLLDEGWSTRRVSRHVGLSQSTVERLGIAGGGTRCE